MNNLIARAFNILNWPLWAKIAAGLVVAILVPVFIGAFIIQSSFASYSLNAEKDKLAQVGTQQLKDVGDLIRKADTGLANVATSQELTERFQTDLEATGTTFQESRQLSLDLQREMVQAGDFRAIRLVNVKGLIVAQATIDQILTKRGFDSKFAAFIAAQNAA